MFLLLVANDKENNGTIPFTEQESSHSGEINNELAGAVQSIFSVISYTLKQSELIRNPHFSLSEVIPDTKFGLSRSSIYSQSEINHALLTNNGFITKIIGDIKNLDLVRM